MNQLIPFGMLQFLLAGLVITLLGSTSASAQPAAAQSTPDRGFPTVWVVAGAGGGFGLGLAVGLHAFDDAINSDQKVWMSAVAGAGAGALLAYLLAKGLEDEERPQMKLPMPVATRPLATRGDLFVLCWRSAL
jgi:hypothetical protein